MLYLDDQILAALDMAEDYDDGQGDVWDDFVVDVSLHVMECFDDCESEIRNANDVHNHEKDTGLKGRTLDS